MTELILASGFQSALEVITAGDRAIGSWIRMATWSVQWAEDGIPCPVPKSARRMFSVTRPVERALLEAGLITENGTCWAIEGEGDLWRQTVPSRSKIPDQLRAAVYQRDGNQCLRCGATEGLSLDHIHPWSKGGKDTFENLRVLCLSCNSSRGNRIEVSDG